MILLYERLLLALFFSLVFGLFVLVALRLSVSRRLSPSCGLLLLLLLFLAGCRLPRHYFSRSSVRSEEAIQPNKTPTNLTDCFLSPAQQQQQQAAPKSERVVLDFIYCNNDRYRYGTTNRHRQGRSLGNNNDRRGREGGRGKRHKQAASNQAYA